MARPITRGRLIFAIFFLFVFLYLTHFFDSPIERQDPAVKDVGFDIDAANDAHVKGSGIQVADVIKPEIQSPPPKTDKTETPGIQVADVIKPEIQSPPPKTDETETPGIQVADVIKPEIQSPPPKIDEAEPPVANKSNGTSSPLKEHMHEIQSAYDFIVVGGGESGLVIANRLSEDSKSTVLVVEYGYLYHDDPKIARPFQPFDHAKGEFHDPKLMYNFTSTPQAALNNRRTPVSAAATVGGGSTVNGMFLNRGAADDYNSWEKLGNPGWGWKDLLPYFKKSVTFTPPGAWLQEEYGATYDVDAAYGGNGPIHASNPAWAWPGSKIQIEGFKELGIEQSKEGAGGEALGMFWVPRAQDPVRQTRSYSVTGHLDPAMKRQNFEILTGHRVRKIILSKDGQAQGVQIQIRNGTETSTVQAKKEIIMCAGFMSSVILQRSGIGPKKILNEAGIDVLVDLPGVGMNLQDHPTSGLSYKFQTDLSLNPGMLYSNETFTADAQAEYDTKKTGPFTGGHNTVAFLPGNNFLSNSSRFASSITSQDIDAYLPQIYDGDETLLAGFAAQRELITEAFTSSKSTLMEIPIAADAYILMILQKPLSRGTITIDPTNPMDGGPLVDFQTMMNPVDIEVMVDTIRFSRRWAATEAMRKLSPLEDWPGLNVQSDHDIMDHIRGMAESSIGHESGTCALMPREKGGVVNTDLLVYGVSGLSVADSSIMPLIPSTNLCATVYAVAEKAADIIKKRHLIKLVTEE